MFQKRGTFRAKALRPACTQVCVVYSKKSSVESRVSKKRKKERRASGSLREGLTGHKRNFGFYSR